MRFAENSRLDVFASYRSISRKALSTSRVPIGRFRTPVGCYVSRCTRKTWSRPSSAAHIRSMWESGGSAKGTRNVWPHCTRDGSIAIDAHCRRAMPAKQIRLIYGCLFPPKRSPLARPHQLVRRIFRAPAALIREPETDLGEACALHQQVPVAPPPAAAAYTRGPN